MFLFKDSFSPFHIIQALELFGYEFFLQKTDGKKILINVLLLPSSSYENFIQRTQFSDNAPDFIRLSYATDCGGQHARIIERNYCQNIELGHVVNFQLNVTLISQPSKELEVSERTQRW